MEHRDSHKPHSDHTPHVHGCDCAHHLRRAKPTEGSARNGWSWAQLGPILACAVCPACLSTYAKVLSAFGVGVFLTEGQHHVLLAVAVGTSLLVALVRYGKTRVRGPLVLTIGGCLTLVAAHAVHELSFAVWVGLFMMLAGGLWEHRLVRRLRGQAPAPQAPAAHVEPS
jgi:hypothetical protein